MRKQMKERAERKPRSKRDFINLRHLLRMRVYAPHWPHLRPER